MSEKMKPRPDRSALDDKGREVVDGIPLAPPVGYRAEMSQSERIRQMIQSEHLRMAAEMQGMESFQQADDFNVDDDYDPSSPYEDQFDPVDYEVRRQLRDDEWRALVEKRLGEVRPTNEVRDGNQSNQGRQEPAEERSSVSSGKSKPGERKDKAPGVQTGLREGSERAPEGD